MRKIRNVCKICKNPPYSVPSLKKVAHTFSSRTFFVLLYNGRSIQKYIFQLWTNLFRVQPYFDWTNLPACLPACLLLFL